MRAMGTLARRLLAGVTVAALAGSGMLVGGVANAQTTAGTFTPSDAATGQVLGTGTNFTSINGVTNGTCDVPGTAAAPVDGFNVVLTGPGVFAPAPPSRPDGLIVVQTDNLGFSTTDPIRFSLRGSFQDFSLELGGPIVPGDYILTFRCVNQFDGIIYQTFSSTLNFTSPTSFTVTNPPLATPTPTPSPTPVPTASPTPVPTASPTPTPVPTASPTPVPTASPTPVPTASPTPVPTASPTPKPTVTPSPTPSPTATPSPTPKPTATPTPVPTASPSPTPKPTATPTPKPSPTATPSPIVKTSTQLFVLVCGDTKKGSAPAVFVARVTPPAAGGTIQFKDGSTNVGSPQKVIYGFAIQVSSLAAGSHNLTAVFAPTDPKAYSPSTSNTVTVVIKP